MKKNLTTHIQTSRDPLKDLTGFKMELLILEHCVRWAGLQTGRTSVSQKSWAVTFPGDAHVSPTIYPMK